MNTFVPQMVALVAVMSIPIVFGYLGVKHSVRLFLAYRTGEPIQIPAKEKLFLAVLASANLSFPLMLAYGWLWEAHWVERVDVIVDTDLSHSVRIVQLSDLHLEGFGRREERALEIVRSAKPDLILLTGDYVSKGTALAHKEHVQRFFSSLEAPFGVYAVPGNWDTNASALVEGTGVELLVGQSARSRVRGSDVWIAGGWYDMPPPSADDSADFSIYLQHSPDYLAKASDAGYNLYLAGHTHGGQVRVPGFGAVVTMSRFWKKYEAGLYREGETYLYVNRGLGLEGGWAPRVRLFCRPEVTVIDLIPKSRAL